METHQIIERTTPNVRYIQDGNGNGWYCYGDVDHDGDLRGQGCISEDEVIHDRNFGG